MEMTVVQFISSDGRTPFQQWFDGLDRVAAAKVRIAIARLQQGNVSNVKSVGGGVSEAKIKFGPGYRVYFGKDGATIVVLLGGGTKTRQAKDVADARARWHDYKQRK